VSKEQIVKDLSSLLDEVDSLPLDATERRRLHGMISDIERHVSAEEPERAHQEVVDTVDAMITRFEADHPSFTGVLRRVLNALGSMGV